ncbi:MAG: lytic transglycosylase domain-containing protein [Pseudomonadota bacterium]
MQKLPFLGLVLASLLVAGSPAAEEPGTSFTFKRVKPPSAGAKRLITIQVEPPEAPERVLDTVLTLEDEKPTADDTEQARIDRASRTDRWFWSAISPRLADAGYGKLAQALRVLDANPGAAAQIRPSAAMIDRIVADYGAEILKATSGTEISPALVVAVIATESAGNPEAKSHAGARGLMQLMPATAERFGVKKIFDPAENITGGVKYLTFLLDRFKGDAVLALAGYNAGEGAVERSAGVPDYRETRHYVPKVVAAWEAARRTCIRPPERATDGCLFAGLRVASDS